MMEIPPSPGLVSSRAAAKLYGCSDRSLIKAMAEDGPEPVISCPESGGRKYWWNPMDVLRVRAIRAERLAEANRKLAAFARADKHRPDKRGAVLKAKQTRLETERTKILTRIALRRGTSVQQLRAESGLDR